MSFKLLSYNTGSLLVLLPVIYVTCICIYRIFFHPLAKYPGPLLAKLTDFYSVYHNYFSDIHLDVTRCHARYGDFIRYGPNKLVVNTANGFHDIYGSGRNVTKSTAYRSLIGASKVHSILTAWDKKQHGRKRRVITQAFSDSALRRYEPAILDHIKTFRDRLLEGSTPSDSQGWSVTKDMARWSNYLSFDIMADVIFSGRLELMTRPDKRFIVDIIDALQHRVGVLSQIPFVYDLGLQRYVLPEGYKAAKRFKDASIDIVMGRVKSEKEHMDAYASLLNAKDPETGKGLDMNELIAEAGVLIIAGSDTTSTALSSTFFYLSRNPRVYEKLAREIRNTFASVEDIRSGPTLLGCHYLQACIDEAMRMSPSLSSPLWREVLEGGVDIDDSHVPAGSWVGTGLYSLFNNSAYFPDPYTYTPERWLEDDKNPHPRHLELARRAFNPFIVGQRACAAKNMANLELLLTIATVMWSMDFRVAPGKEGMLGQGGKGMGRGREREDVFQIYGYFVVVGKHGPALQFRPRRDL